MYSMSHVAKSHNAACHNAMTTLMSQYYASDSKGPKWEKHNDMSEKVWILIRAQGAND